jgi:hypothetical protein
MDQKAVLSYSFQREEEGCSESLFHSRVKVQERACALTIDHMSLINAVSLEMVEKLELPITLHPHPYLLHWGRKNLTITHQTKIHFSLGKLSMEVWCDVIPVHMVSCHLLLGIPWNKEHGAVYSLDSNYNYSQYTVTCGKRECKLHPLDTMTYKAWRKDRLQKKKDREKVVKKEAEAKIQEQEEAKKKEVEAATFRHVLVQSTTEDAKTATISGVQISDAKSFDDAAAKEDDLKPRTVSFEEGEDDMAHLIFDVTQPDGLETKINRNHSEEIAYISSGIWQDFYLFRSRPRELVQIVHAGDDESMTKSDFLFLFEPVREKYKETNYTARDKIDCYFFGLPRPPEKIKLLGRRLLPMEYLSMHAAGVHLHACQLEIMCKAQILVGLFIS